MTWPPQSADLIELVWNEMDCRGKAKGQTSAQHHWGLQEYWETISGDYLMQLIKRVPTLSKGRLF